ncbi:UNVERIFIED_ORG: type I restriction enzyme S subunit [Agrobacterium larrymoorei]|nr:type I restriction enzyme S subunit [Agrobacterium larrymoorei]
MKQVPALELSGQHVDWIGALPAHWRVVPLKRLFQIVGGSTPKSDQPQFWDGDIIWITPTDLAKDEIADLHSSQRTITEEGLESCGTSLVPPNSIVLSTRAPIGSLGVSKVALCTNQGCRTLVPSADVDPRFVAFSLSIAREQLRIRGKGTTFLELSGDELGAFPIAAPDLPEQAAIAAFLDRETTKIDALVEEQRRLIELLKEKRQAAISHSVTKGLNPDAPLKVTGIEWLDEVPKHWEVVRIKRGCALITDGAHISPETENGVFPFISTKDVRDDGIDFEGCLRTSADNFELLVRSGCQPLLGDVLFSKDGTIGRTVVVRETRDFVVASSLIILRPDRTILSPDFLSYLCQSSAISQQVASYVKGAGLPRLSIKNLLRVFGCIPPLEEQREIVVALDEQMLHLDSLAAQAKAAIELLNERRAALISAAVTGKIDVRQQQTTSVDRDIVRSALGFEIVRRLAHRPTFGRVKLQKIIYLAETYAGIEELGGSYQREAAGPLDRMLIANIETLLQQDRELLIEQPEGRGSAVSYRFVEQRPKAEKEELGSLLGHRRERFEQVLTKVGDLDTKGAEAVATLFAVWNDALLDRSTISDEGIITGFLTEWHPEKPLKFKRDELHTWLGWMRRNGIIPVGQGPRTQTGRLVI